MNLTLRGYYSSLAVVASPSFNGEVTADRFIGSSTGGCTEDSSRGIFKIESSGGGTEDVLLRGGGADFLLRWLMNGGSSPLDLDIGSWTDVGLGVLG